MESRKHLVKNIILDIIDYLRFQIENGKFTVEELQSIHKMIAENMEIDATIKDISKFYGQSENNVRNITVRTLCPRPKRRVYYNFAIFSGLIHKSWRLKRNEKSQQCD